MPLMALTRMEVVHTPEKLRVCYEAEPTWYVLYWQLTELGVKCEVVAPTLVQARAGDRVKTDRRDAEELAHSYRSGDPTPVWVPDAAHKALVTWSGRARPPRRTSSEPAPPPACAKASQGDPTLDSYPLRVGTGHRQRECKLGRQENRWPWWVSLRLRTSLGGFVGFVPGEVEFREVLCHFPRLGIVLADGCGKDLVRF